MRTHLPPLAHAAAPDPCPARPDAVATITCLGRTCLHWRADGELNEDDRDLVLQRLRQVDPQVTIPVEVPGGPGRAA